MPYECTTCNYACEVKPEKCPECLGVDFREASMLPRKFSVVRLKSVAENAKLASNHTWVFIGESPNRDHIILMGMHGETIVTDTVASDFEEVSNMRSNK